MALVIFYPESEPGFVTRVFEVVIQVLLTVALGFWTWKLQARIEQSRLYKVTQLRDFYAPIRGYLERIIQTEAASKKNRHDSYAASRVPRRTSLAGAVNAARHDQDLFDYDRAVFINEVLPLYKEMLEVFTKNYYLADANTTKEYPELIKFVDKWTRYAGGGLGNIENEICSPGFLETLNSCVNERLMTLSAEVSKN